MHQLPTNTQIQNITAKMSRQNLETEELLSHLSHQSTLLSRAMSPMCDPPKPMGAWQPQGDPSSLGVLAILPVELLHELLEKLDFRSITRFSRASIRARRAVQSLPAYRDLMSHAPHALDVLRQTRMIRRHTASQLVAALRAEQCAICSAFGPYLYLPTCERVCWACLRRNQTLRAVPRKTASRVFGLSRKQVRQLPCMLTMAGTYGLTQKFYWYRYKLVSVRAAIELAISVHGSLESLCKAVRGRTFTGRRAEEHRRLQGALELVVSGKCDSVFILSADRDMFWLWPPDKYFGMASIPFPSLTRSHSVEPGLFCNGCEWASSQKHRLPGYAVSGMVPPGCDPRWVRSGLKTRVYSRAGLLEHVKHCYGANHLLSMREKEK